MRIRMQLRVIQYNIMIHAYSCIFMYIHVYSCIFMYIQWQLWTLTIWLYAFIYIYNPIFNMCNWATSRKYTNVYKIDWRVNYIFLGRLIRQTGAPCNLHEITEYNWLVLCDSFFNNVMMCIVDSDCESVNPQYIGVLGSKTP